jgi:hypothetical protein
VTAAPAAADGGALQFAGDLLVGAGGRRRQVPGALVRIQDLGQRAMGGDPAGDVGLGPRGRADQRMPELDRARAHLQQPGPLGRCEVRHRPAQDAHRLGDGVDVPRVVHRRDEDTASGRLRKGRDPFAERRLHPVRRTQRNVEREHERGEAPLALLVGEALGQGQQRQRVAL